MLIIQRRRQATQTLAAVTLASLCTAPLAQAAVNVKIHELRTDQLIGGFGEDDPEEYVELIGPPGTSLDGLTYIVIGDGDPEQNSGVIEAVIPLTGSIIGPSGLFVIAQPTFTLGKADLLVPNAVMNFEDDDNVSHFLVENFSGFLGQDLDPNDDSVIGSVPWTATLSSIALVKVPYPSRGTEHVYGADQIGPDGSAAPCHAYRGHDCGAWQLGAANLEDAADSPGAQNPNCPPSPPTTIFGLPHTPIGAMVWLYTAYGDYWFMSWGPIAGMTIDLCGSETAITPAWEGELLFDPMGNLDTGSVFTFAMRDDNIDLATLTMSEFNDGDAALGLSQLLCETCALTVELIEQGEVVASGVFAPPFPEHLVTGAIGSTQYRNVRLRYAGAAQLASGDLLTLTNSEIATFTIAGQPAAQATAIRMRLQDMPAIAAAHQKIFFTTNWSTPNLGIRSESLIANGVAHQSWYSEPSKIIAGDDSDSDGEPDIVVMKDEQWAPLEDFSAVMVPPDLNVDGVADAISAYAATVKLGSDGALGNETRFRVQLDAQGSTSHVGAGHLELVASPGAAVSINAAFPDVNATLHTTEILLNGTIVHAASGRSGTLIANVPADSTLHECSAQFVPLPGEISLPQLSFKFSAGERGIAFTLPDQSTHLGDEVRVTADDPTSFFQFIKRVHLIGAKLPGDSFSIIDDRFIVIDTCPADIAPWQGNGTVDVDDLLLVINNWGVHGENPADVTSNGVVDVDDLLAVINAWGECE